MPSSPDAGASPLLPPTIAEYLADVADRKPCTLRGWVRSARASRRVAFIAMDDGSTSRPLQVVLPLDRPGLAAALPQATTGAGIEVQGTWSASPGREQAWEVQAEHLHVLGAADPQAYPLQKKQHSLEFLRTIAHLRPRTRTFAAIFRVRSTLAQATHAFFRGQSFHLVHTPMITTSDCEGAGELFGVSHRGRDDFFGRPAFLTVSGQLAGEALAYGLGRIYTFGPTFRAENSNTARHLSEFLMCEPEVAFATAEDNQRLAEAYLKHCLREVLSQHPDDLDILAQAFDGELVARLEHIASAPFLRLPYGEAIAILQKSGTKFDYPPCWGNDLQAEHERFLVEQHLRQPAVIVDYPRKLKAFYMFNNEDGETVAAMDVLVPRIGEIIGGSQREHRVDRLAARLAQDGTDPEPYQWYLDLHRFGGVPHSGFGLGFERLVMLACGVANVRDTIPFPRAPGQAHF